MLERIRSLSMLDGISGRETEVARYICGQLDGKCAYTVDRMGNILAEVKGQKTPAEKIMISAHMDEVGMICTDVTEDGFLRVAPVGGLDPRVVMGRTVTVGKAVGVIGTKAVHMQTEEERAKSIPFDEMLLDIGADSRADALHSVSVGDAVCFQTEFRAFGDGKLAGKALDDRVGCAILLRLIESEPVYDFTAVFCVQEEVGLRGATAAVQTVEPDVAFVLEATTAADIAEVDGYKQVCRLGGGAVVGFMDKSTIYDRALYELAFAAAREAEIPCQTKTMIAGGNDAGAIHKSRGGVRTLAISVPSRYIHSPVCVVQEQDIESAYRLLCALLERQQSAEERKA